MTYKEYIDSIIEMRGQWNIPSNEYWEGHHIIPKCLGGEGRSKAKHINIIRLYPQEHFIAHKLLALENPQNSSLVLAWSMMAFPKGKTKRKLEISAEDYATLRKLQSELMSKDNPSLRKTGHPWNYGKTGIYTEEAKAKMGPHGQHWNNSQEARQHLREALKTRDPNSYAKPTKDRLAVTNGIVTHYIEKDALVPEGYKYGMHTKGGDNTNYILAWTDERKAEQSLRSSGSGNNMYQQGYKISGGKNGHAIYIYAFEGIDYQCRDDLMVVLKERFPGIAESTIRKIMKNDYSIRIKNKFQYVIDNLTWRLKNENKSN